ncbi:MAG TPA: ABC transporter permease [Candidatus Polarisedimenticolia bacterium]|nr:ABC transporter permease [Candidatus Polarisedimenticolia bacterium]
MDDLIRDLRYAFRFLLSRPTFSAIAVLTLALGIGANTAIFSVVNGVLLRPLPYRDPGRLVLVAERTSYPTVSTSYQNFVDWRDQSRSFESMEATRATTMTLSGAGEPERLNARMVTAGLFDMLGARAEAGRTFLADEDKPNGAPVAILSHGLWERRFGGSRQILGKPVNLDGQPYTVVGILPAGFQILQPADFFLPFTPWAATLPDDRNWHPGIIALARLKPGVSREQARQEMIGIAKRLETQYPLYNTDKSADVVGLQDQLVKDQRPALLLLLGAVSFVLLIACVNLANLLLARAATRGREVAVRTALGASRGRLIRQLLTESVLLAAAGGTVGLAVAWAALGWLLKMAADSIPQGAVIGVDASVLAFTAGVSLLAGILFGIVPALRTATPDLREALNEGSRGSTGGPGQHRLRSALVIMEIAFAMVLLVGSGLLLRSFSRLQDVPPGFRPDHLLVVDLPASPTTYAEPARRYDFYDRLIERARALPGVRAAAAASFLPVSGGGSMLHFNVKGKPPGSPKDFTAAGYRAVTPGYFEALGVPLLRGRHLTAADRDGRGSVVLVNATMAKTYFPGVNPLGQWIQLGATPEAEVPWMEVVGVVGDVRQGLALDPQAEMYLPFRQADQLLPVFQLSLVLRSAGEPLAQVQALRSAVAEIDPDQPLVKVRTMEENMAASVAQPRFRTWLIGIFAGIALALAAVGIYGVMSYTVTQRTSEIGVRVTLGARPVEIFRIIVGQGLRLACIGVGFGLAAALAATRLLESFLFGVSAYDPWTLAGVAILLVLVSLAACLLPARRATRMDPVAALRCE